jgi:uncharacterized membrane protein YvbJ
VFCSKCGCPNAEGAAFCAKCGSALPNSASAPAQSTGVAPPPAQSGSKKNPIVAAVLNFFFGVGYLYLGYKKVLGLPAILFVVVALLIFIVLGTFTAGLLPLVLAIVMAYDGYVKANGEKGYIGTEPALLYK